MFGVVLDGVCPRWLDDERAKHPELFLEAGVAVVPVRPTLPNRKAVGEGLTRGDSSKANAWYAVHVRRENQTVPVHRGVDVEAVLYPQDSLVSLFEPERWTWDRAIECDCLRGLTIDGDFSTRHDQVGGTPGIPRRPQVPRTKAAATERHGCADRC